MSTTDFERIVDIYEINLVAIPAGLHAAKLAKVYQGIAMNAIETIGKFRFEIFERFLDQHFTFDMAHGDIFLIGLKIVNIFDRHQYQVTAYPRTDMLARFNARKHFVSL